MNSRRFTAFLLSIVMMLTLLPVGVFADAEPHVHYDCGLEHQIIGTHVTDNEIEFNQWTSSTTLPNSGRYYLTKDVVLTTTAVLTGSLVLCLNGHSITSTAANTSDTTYEGTDVNSIISTSRNLTICNCSNDPAIIRHTDDSKGLGIRATSALNLFGITIDNCKQDSKVYANKNYSGGGVYATGNVNIKNCVIQNCENKSNANAGLGAGIFLYGADKEAYIDNTTIKYCSAYYGGGLFITFPSINVYLTNSVIEHCSATNGGGAMENNGIITISDTTVEYCSVSGAMGGGLSNSNDYSSAQIILKDNVTITNCTAEGRSGGAGGLCMTNSNIILDGNNITIAGNTPNDACFYREIVNSGSPTIRKIYIRENFGNSSIGIYSNIGIPYVFTYEPDIAKDYSSNFFANNADQGIVANDSYILTIATKASSPSGITATGCSILANNDGVIGGVDSTMEYLASGGAWTPGTGADITGLVPGDYEVRTKATATLAPSDSVPVTIAEYVGTKEPTPTTADFSAETMLLTGIASGMKYRINSDSWNPITASPVNLSSDVTGPCTINVINPGDGEHTLDSDPQVITITKAAAPSVLSTTTPSSFGMLDGSITGTNTTMEYKLSTGLTWADCTDSEITGLAASTYQVRVKAKGTVLASDPSSVTVPEGLYNMPAVTAVPYAGTYDGASHAAVSLSGTVPGATIAYGETAGTYNLSSVPSYTNAGSYPVYYKITASSYNDLTGSAIATIAQKSISGAAIGDFDALTYSGSAQTPSAVVTIGGLTATGSWSNVTNVADKTTFTADGNFIGTIAEQNPGMHKKTANALSLDAQVTAPVKNGTPQTSFAKHEQYTGTISWVSNPAKFLGGISYIAKLQLTATDNYSIDGVSFTYTGASVISTSGGAVTITFVETDAPVVTSIAITTPATKTTYEIGETLDIAGLAITATNDDGTTTVPAVTAAMVSGFNSSTAAASQTLTVTYEGCTATYGAVILKHPAPSAPDVTYSLIGSNAEKIMGAVAEMEYSTDGISWTDCTANMDLPIASPCTLSVRVKETAVTYAGTAKEIVIIKATAPSGFTPEKPSVLGLSDGSISGTDVTMEYKASEEAEWTAAAGTEITGLAAGTYQIRTAAVEHVLASDPTDVVVPAGYPNMEITASGYEAAYDGEAHTITLSGAPSGAAITYSTASNGAFSSAPIEFTNFTNGPQTVYFKAVADRYNDFEGTATVNITKLDITGAEVGSFGALTYTGFAQTPVASVIKAGLAVTGSWSDVTNVADKTTFTANGNFTGSIADQSTGMAKAVVAALDLSGLVTAPAKNGIPQSSVAGQAQYKGTISWAGSPAKFLGETVYTATITLTATANYTLIGVAENAFTYAGASAENAADSGVVTITFPATGAVAASSAAITNPAEKTVYKIGEELDITGLEITVTYDNDTTTVPAITASMISGFDSSSAGTKTVTITFEGVSAFYDVTVQRPAGSHKPAAPKPQEPEVPETNAFPFTDVKENAYFRSAVEWAVENGITSGVSKDKFGAGQNCSRAQMITFLWIAAGKPEVDANIAFKDVPAGAYYEKAVKWAYATGITAGVSKDMFGINRAVTRAQTVTYLWALAGRPDAATNGFTDVNSSDYFAKAAEWAKSAGITAGIGNGKFGPNNECLREQIITFMYNYFN